MLNAKNNAVTILSASINSSITSLTVADASVLPVAPFVITIDNEIMTVTNVVGNVLTVTRGAESTTPTSHLAGVPVENRWTAGMHKEIIDGIDSHLAEMASYVTALSRDSSIAGVQLITLPFKAKSIYIVASIQDTKKWSTGMYAENGNQRVMYSREDDNNFRQSSNAVYIYTSSTTYIIGTIQNVTETGFEINWVKTGSPTGSISMSIMASTHGGVA